MFLVQHCPAVDVHVTAAWSLQEISLTDTAFQNKLLVDSSFFKYVVASYSIMNQFMKSTTLMLIYIILSMDQQCDEHQARNI